MKDHNGENIVQNDYITQKALRDYLNLKDEVDELNKLKSKTTADHKKKKAQLELFNDSILEALDAGMMVAEKGTQVSVDEKEGRFSIPWKDVAFEYAAKQGLNEIQVTLQAEKDHPKKIKRSAKVG